MKKGYKDHTPRISLTVLATLCFVTLIMSQTRFRVSKEMSEELYPPVLRSKDCWFLYTIGNPDRFKCVLRAFIVISSPLLSLISTGLLLLGKVESNPYLFIPWLFLTMKGLLLIQTDNLITILRDMATRTNYTYGFRMEDVKWVLLYFTVFMINLVETSSFCEIFDLFLVLWNHHPGYDVKSTNLSAVKREIDDIIETFSKCSLESLSKISLGSLTESEDVGEGTKEQENARKVLPKNEQKYEENATKTAKRNKRERKSEPAGRSSRTGTEKGNKIKKTSSNLNTNISEGDKPCSNAKSAKESSVEVEDSFRMLNMAKIDLPNINENIFIYNTSVECGLQNNEAYSPDILCS